MFKECISLPTVFITHGHLDHIGALHLHAAQRGTTLASISKL